MKNIIKFLVRKVPRPVLIRISLIANKPVSWFYRGDNVECPVCEHTFRKFLPYGNQGIENRLCPFCLSLERHRLIWKFLKEETEFFTANWKVLHLAPEQPFLTRFKALPNLDYITADLVSPLADVKTDIRDMAVFEDNTFDFFMANHVMEHIDEEQKALKEILRILKPGGTAILQVPTDYTRETTYEDPSITSREAREKHFGQYDHVRLYGRDYPERLRKAGFEVTENDMVKKMCKDEIKRFRYDENEIIYVAKKPLL